MVRDMEPSTPPKSGPLTAPRSSVSGAIFMDDAIDHHTDKNKDLKVEEPTSPVVNCMGQVGSSLSIRTLCVKWTPSGPSLLDA